ncbi:uncharacterized protein LOC105283337 isoform X2 [Ooceraea biroi]|uniref:uncharacterized protein LOC105283337 isoform X2 n=1 Tax=Ooceraea biroi TaxID=2015173 RepID=UPI000F09151A|nr:uncharacterized protein LOC105283337 isoform X2 [Ooceraea biroi]
MSISVQERYFSWNRILLLAVGLWPYHQSRFARFQAAFGFSILTSFVVFLFSRLWFADYSIEFNSQLLCMSTYYMFLITKYVSFWINIEPIRYLLEQFQYIYKTLKNSKEIAIYDKYAIIAKRITIGLTMVAICNLVCFIAMLSWPFILDMIMPQNESYVQLFIVHMTEYFAIQEKYFYLFLLHLYVVSAVAGVSFLATGTMLLSCLKHICGILRIASYRFDRAIPATLQSITLKNETIIYKELIYAVDIHRKAMECAKFFMDNMERSLLVLTMITVLCMSLNLYGIFQVKSSGQDMGKTMGHLLFVFFLFLYLFTGNYAGQEIVDCNNYMFLTLYNAPWYLAPLQIQKFILFLLQRSNKTFTLSIGGLFTLSIECFGSENVFICLQLIRRNKMVINE